MNNKIDDAEKIELLMTLIKSICEDKKINKKMIVDDFVYKMFDAKVNYELEFYE